MRWTTRNGRWLVVLAQGSVALDAPDHRERSTPRALRRILRRAERRAAAQVRQSMERSERLMIAVGFMHCFPVRRA